MVDTGEPVPYMERTRQYYRALGYAKDYVWARHDEVPFCEAVETAVRMPPRFDHDGKSGRV